MRSDHMIRRLVAALSYGMVVALAFACTSPTPTNSPRTSPTPPPPVSPEQALVCAETFIAADGLNADLLLTDVTDVASHATYWFRGSQASVSVSAADCSVTSLLVFSNQGFGPRAIDETAAVTTAETFLARHEVPIGGMDRTAEWRDHGETSEYQVDWTRHEAGVLAPNSIVVGVDASTGAVFRYSRFFRPYETPDVPLIDRQAAEAIAKGLVGGNRPLVVEKSELQIGFTPAGEQRLVWAVEVSGPAGGAEPRVRAYWWVEVDARTGQARITGRG